MSDKPNNPLWKKSGIFLFATGIIHNIFGILAGYEVMWDAIQDGWFNAFMDYERQVFFWFLLVGVFMKLAGQILHHNIKKHQTPPPRCVGIYLLVMAAIGCAAMPASGFWLFIPQGIIILLAKNDD